MAFCLKTVSFCKKTALCVVVVCCLQMSVMLYYSDTYPKMMTNRYHIKKAKSFNSIQTNHLDMSVAVVQSAEKLSVVYNALVNMRTRIQSSVGPTLKTELEVRIQFILQKLDEVNSLRSKENKKLSDQLSLKVQESLYNLQHPASCKAAKKLYCSVPPHICYGGNLHHVIYCLHMGLISGRTVIIKRTSFSHPKILLPTTKCSLDVNQNMPTWDGSGKDDLSIPSVHLKVPVITRLDSSFPMDAIPRDVAPYIRAFHGFPVAWWQGQMVKFLMTPTDKRAEQIRQVAKDLRFSTPIVGIHIRRTDKMKLKHHSDSVYMRPAIDWFDLYDHKLAMEGKPPLVKRRIFLATDDPTTVFNITKAYPGYEFVNDMKAANISLKRHMRRHLDVVTAVIIDLELLSRCSHLVCDPDSNICRLAYELMQSRHVDASTRVTWVSTYYHNIPSLSMLNRTIDYYAKPAWRYMAQEEYAKSILSLKYQYEFITKIAPFDLFRERMNL